MEKPVIVVEDVDARRYGEYVRERLEAALAGLADGAEVSGDVQQALLALHVLYGSTEAITLVPTDIAEDVERPKLKCICPPGLVARGGFRSGCPIHHQ
jgi:hypothetical protein